MKKNRWIVLLFVLLFSIISCYFLFFNHKEEKIKIGFVGALTGKYSVLGNAMINGVILAFEEIDYTINGKKIELLFKDDKQDKILNEKIVQEYINNDVKIVIGNVTSNMSKISMSIINKHKDMFMISASSASSEFTGKDDQFFRVHVANNIQRFDTFTKYILDNGYKKVYGIYDPFNEAYAKDYLINFEKSLVLNGGNPFIKYAKTNQNLDYLVEDIKKVNPDLILICANSVDAARVIQYARLKGLKTQFASSEWARTPSFLENSGKSSEGVIFNIDFDEHSINPKFQKFIDNYTKKYNVRPSMFASKAYELSQVLIEMLNVGSEVEIKQNVLKRKEFAGLQDKIVFDQYGDVIRDFYTFKVIDGKFVRVK